MKLSQLMIVWGALMVAGCASGPGPEPTNWTCSAKGLKQSSYAGGNTALIHLRGFSRGARYEVTLSEDGRTATGKTGNGTPFTCSKKEGA